MGNQRCYLLSSYPRDDVVLVRSVEELACVLDAHCPVGGCKLNLDATHTMAEISLHDICQAAHTHRIGHEVAHDLVHAVDVHVQVRILLRG